MGILIAFAFLLSGCDDPSNVGQGLLDAQSNDTEVIRLEDGTVSASDRGDLTGGNSVIGSTRALFGQVNDPVIGSFASHGFVDFVPASQLESGFINGTVSWAGLDLNIDYQYGDTTQAVVFDLYTVTDAWASTGLRADSTVNLGRIVASYEMPATSGVSSIDLPADWVAEFDAQLRSSEFSDTFHGFGLLPRTGDAVLGIRFSETELRASAVPGDTVSYPLSKVGTLTDDSGVQAPAGHVMLRDGSSKGLDLRFQLEGGSLDESLIHRVILKMQSADWSGSYPAGFARPLPGVLTMEAVSADGDTRLGIAEVAINLDGAFIVDNTTLTNVFQSANLGKSVLDRFEFSFPAAQSGVGFLSFPMTEIDPSIEILLTRTPIN